jgi:Rho-binding antiterminator
MMQTNSDYKPVSCDLSDELEAISVRKQSVLLKIKDAQGAEDWRQGRIDDLFTKDHAEFLKLADGTVIRLDKIIEWRHV